MRFIIAFFICCFLPLNAHAQGEGFSVGMAEDHIDITVGFDGASMRVFGYREDIDTQVAIVIAGPKKDITMWKKERVLWAWVNRRSATFPSTPSYYNVALSGISEDGFTAEELQHLNIGHDAILNVKDNDSVRAFLKEALISIKKEKGLFFGNSTNINFIQDRFFRASFDIPSSAPVGDYMITSFLIKDGDIIQKHVSTFKVQQVGLNAFINNSAKEHSIVYALFCIILALFSGWFVGILKIK